MSPSPRPAPVATPTGDDRLVARCRAGDGEAWRALYELHAPQIFRFVSAMGLRDEERDDVCQEIFLAVYRSLGGFRGEARLSTWIYRIAAREVGHHRRKRTARALLASVLLAEPPPPLPDPTERAGALHLLDTLLARLSPRKKLVLVLFEIEGLSAPEIARIAGCGENTVWSRLHHARRDLMALAERRKTRDALA